ncbi:MAG: STAS domain-containing protein [Mycobacteriales bacterium]
MSEDLPGVDTGDLKVDVVADGGAVVVVATGEVDMLTAPTLSEALGTAADQVAGADAGLVVLDCAGVSFLDSTGLGAIAGAHQKITDNGGKLRLAALRPHVTRVLQITGLAEHWELYPSRADALNA